MVKRILPEKSQSPYYVYVLQTESGAVKIGISNAPNRRLANIQGANHERVSIAYSFETPSEEIARALEAVLHERYSDDNIHLEWFNVPPEKVAADIRFAVAFARVVKSIVYEQVFYDEHTALSDDSIIVERAPVLHHAPPSPEAEMDDWLYNTAEDLVRRVGKASGSLLHRRLHVGKPRADRLLALLEERGVFADMGLVKTSKLGWRRPDDL